MEENGQLARQLKNQFINEGGKKNAIPDLLDYLEDHGVSVNYKLLRQLALEIGSTQILAPDYICEFLRIVLSSYPPESMLDVSAGVGEVILPLISAFNPKRALAITRSTGEQEIARTIMPEASGQAEWYIGDPLGILDEIRGLFDFVFASPPVGLPKQDLIIKHVDQEISLHDHLDYLIILKTALMIDPEGSGFFLTRRSFLTTSHVSKSVAKNLAKFGLFLDAAFELPQRSFSPLTSAPFVLIVLRRIRENNRFLGRLSPKSDENIILAENYLSRVEGKVSQLGKLTEVEGFETLEVIEKQEEIEKLGRESQLPPRPLRDIALAINLSKSKTDYSFEILPNCVYLPLIGTSPAVSSVEHFQIKPQNYAQIVLDADRASAEYLAGFFNSAFGWKIRESLLSGTTIPKITKANLTGAVIYLPSLGIQEAVISTNSAITDLQTQAQILRRRLWSHPLSHDQIREAAVKINQDEAFTDWIEQLPFPLASILWTYHASGGNQQKVDHLFHFFEAYSQFTSTLMLSAFASEKVFFDDQIAEVVIEKDPQYQSWYEAASFGSWNTLAARLSKKVRQMLSDKEQTTQAKCVELFGGANRMFLEALSDKGITVLLDEANRYRNLWKGHGGVKGEAEFERELTILGPLLAKLRSVIADVFRNSMILKPGNSEFSGGIYIYNVRALMGSRTPFQQAEIESRIPLDVERLYLHHRHRLRPVELLPFFKIMRSPKTQQNACYFYNRIGDEGARWVSYHFEPEAEIIRQSPELEEAFDLFKPPS